MKIVRENLWILPPAPGMIVVTTNGAVNKDGELVMGRGAALEAKQRIPGIAKEAGALLWGIGCENPAIYHWLVMRAPYRPGKVGFGLFQVKRVWSDDASLDMIRKSAQALAEYAKANPTLNIRMNYPGIGNGRLKRNDVEPLLCVLPDNVTICMK
jgi:hypothetical protein